MACGPHCLENGIPSKVFTSGDAVCKCFSIWDFEKGNWKVPGPQHPRRCGRNYLWPECETRRHERKRMGGGRQLARGSEHKLSLLQTVRVEHFGFWTSSANRGVPRLVRGWPPGACCSPQVSGCHVPAVICFQEFFYFPFYFFSNLFVI